MKTRTNNRVEDGRMITFARLDDTVLTFQKVNAGLVVSFYRKSDALEFRTRTYIAGHDAYRLLQGMATQFKMNVNVDDYDEGLDELMEALNGIKCENDDDTEGP